MLEKPAQRSQIKVEILLFEAELSSQPIDFFCLAHQGEAQPLDLFIGERAGVDAPERLAFQYFVQELDKREDKLSKSVFQTVRIQIQAGPARSSVMWRPRMKFVILLHHEGKVPD